MEVWNTVGQAAIGLLVESVLGTLFTDKLSSWLRRVNLDDDVEELVWEMRNVAVVLEAAKGMKVGENEPMAGSLFHLKDLLYDAEDVLDKLDYCRLHEQNTKGNSRDVTSTSTSSFFSNSWFTGWKRKRGENLRLLNKKSQFSATIKQIAGKLRDVCGDVNKGLNINTLKSPEASNLSHQSTPLATNATTSYLLEPEVLGREVETESIKKLITTNNRSNGITVVPIVGIGGIGKTTLAQHIYKDPAIGSQFKVKIWVHVSAKFDMLRVTREILECVSKKKPKEASNFNMLQQDLEKQIKYKRLLIVLDDVWDVRTDDWKKLLAPLRLVNPSQEEASQTTGNMIIMTTRLRSVAECLGTEQSINLEALKDDVILSLLEAHAFGNDKHGSNPTLQDLGRIIAKELKGNPLAAKTVGALLRRSLTIDHWSSIIVNKEWQSLQRTDGIMHALKLSYDHLPNQLQQCFSYCSLFPKGYSFSEAQLVQMWIAQGFVEKSSEKLERKGVEYLEELVNSGFFQQVKSMWSSSEDFVMHDLMHDLARMVSQTECATIDGLECKELASSIRHLSIVTDSVYHEDKFGKISRNEEFEKRLLNVRSRSKLRTLVLIGKYDPHFFQSFQDAFKEAQHLRLLHITSTYDDFGSFLSRLVNSTHLRYLRLENDEFDGALPQALSNCYHLQVLDIGSCGIPSFIPNDINNLVNLRHLVGEDGVLSHIAGIGEMTSLQELTNFKVQNSIGFEIAQIRSMSELVELGVSQLKNITCRDEACDARLRDKQNLEKLHLSWMGAMSQVGHNSDKSYDSEYETESYDNEYETEGERRQMSDTIVSLSSEHFPDIASAVLHGLEPHHNLKHLRISGFNGATSPTWLPSSLTCLRTLHLEKCGKWQRLPLESLSLLTKLVLIKMRNATEVSIPSLEMLVLIELPSLNTCSCTSVRNLNSSLKVLKIKNCPALEVFPLFENCQQFEIERTSSWLPHLSKLTIYNCPLLCVGNSLPPSSIVSKLSIGKVSTLPTVRGSSSGTLRIGRYPYIFDEDSDQLKTLDDKVLSFHNLRFLTELTIYDCRNLVTISLESLRQLVCLKSLELHYCPKLLSPDVPPELTCEYMSGANHSALTSLERLSILYCGIMGKRLSLMLQHVQALQELSLEECQQITGLSIGEEDPSLGYPGRDKLLRLPLNLIHSLKKVSIKCCDDLIFYGSKEYFTGFTSLEELVIWACPKLLSSLAHNDGRLFLPLSLGKLQLGYVDSLKALQPCFSGNLTRLKQLKVHENQSLTSLQLHSYTALEELIIENCESFNSLEGLQSLSNLRLLRAYRCLSGYGEYGRFILPQSLEKLYITEYSQETLQPCFPDNLTRLRKLVVRSNQSLTSLQLHSCTALEELIIGKCESFNSLEGLQSLGNLRLLWAHRCLSDYGVYGRCILPQSLKELYISEYSQETLQPCFMNLTCLKKLEVSFTASLKALKLQSCIALEHLNIDGCASLATLEGLQFLHALRQLEVYGCPILPPYLESLSGQGYELCPRLEMLKIDDPSILTTSFCKHLTSLQRLAIYSYEWEMERLTDQQEMALLLLTSLQELQFWYCSNLIDLPTPLHSLPSLKRLEICYCSSITKLPEKGLPPSLEELDIICCSKELADQCIPLASKMEVKIRRE